MSVDLIKDLVFLIIFCQALQAIASREKSFASRCARARGGFFFLGVCTGMLGALSVSVCTLPLSVLFILLPPPRLPEKKNPLFCVVLERGEKKGKKKKKALGFVRLL